GALTPSAVECVGCGVRWPRRGWCESAVVRVGRADCSRDCGCAIPRTRTTHAPAPTCGPPPRRAPRALPAMGRRAAPFPRSGPPAVGIGGTGRRAVLCRGVERHSQVHGDVPGLPQLVGEARRRLVLLLGDRLLGQLLLDLLE